MKYLSLFSGIGAFEKALDKLNKQYELVAYCDIDKYASKSYSAIHNVPESMNLWDITKVDEKALPKDIDLITYGFPCQDISIAGKQKGMKLICEECGHKYDISDEMAEKIKNGEKLICKECKTEMKLTRSGLFFEALRIIEATQPKVAIAENVKNLTSKKFNAQFHIVLDSLEQAGYNNYWEVLNSKDYGIPQNRERVFIVSIRKDIDTGLFRFPEGFPLELRLKDMLEDEVDEKYYLSNSNTEKLFNTHTGIIEESIIGGMQKNQSIKTDGIVTTLTSSMGTGGGYVPMYAEPQVKQIGNCCPTKTRDNPNQGRIYDTEGLAPCLNQMGGGNRQPFVTEPQQAVVEQVEKLGETSYCIDANYWKGTTIDQFLNKKRRQLVADNLRIRKLTPKECFRLMGFDDDSFHKAEAVNSNTQLYKQAGNSIVVDVLFYIFQSLIQANIL